MEIGVKGAGGVMVWMCGVVTSRALMLRLFVWLKHCFGVLVILDCCFVMIVQVTGAMELNMDLELLCLCGAIVELWIL